MYVYYFSVKLFKQKGHTCCVSNVGLCIPEKSLPAAEDQASRELILGGFDFDCYELFLTDVVKEV